jgi:hypothetical protein
MLPEEWEQHLIDTGNSLRRPANPIKRHQPKVTRHSSRRMRQVSGQQIDPVKAIFQPENQFNRTPLLEDGTETTREVGPGDVNNSNVTWRTGNMTVEPSINGNKVKPKAPGAKGSYVKKAAAPWGNKVRTDYTALAAKFMIE